jgi:LruC domain-containing protein
MRPVRRPLLPCLALTGALISPPVALAQDSDGDGAPDASDAYPCDATRASVSYFPGQSTSALLAFEDQWPGHTDVDFNDVALRVHYRLERNASGAVVQLVAVIDPVALGGDLSNGLGLQLPTSRTGVTVRRRVGGGAWQAVGLESDSNATMVLSGNLRELYSNASGRINSRANEARQSGQRLEVEVSFATPASLSTASAPFDVFVFRSGNLGHQIHFPQYSGTAAMNASLFNSDQDASTSTRRFVNFTGVPAALNLMTTTRYPLEGVGVSSLFPDIAGFASSGGASNTSFYTTNVVSAQGHDVAALALPSVAAADTACAVGRSAANPGLSCRAILAASPGAPSGTYWLDPDGASGVSAFQTACDMTTRGGGWTRLYFKNAANSCTRIAGVEWTPSLLEALQIQDFAVSGSLTTLNLQESYILRGVTFTGNGLDGFANLARCLTPTGTTWSLAYDGGYVFFNGILETAGSWTSLYAGCNTYWVNVGASHTFRSGGAVSHTGEFIHSYCNDYSTTGNAIVSRWSWSNTRAIWVR